MELIHPALRYLLALAYLYGAAVHVANMAGQSGFVWCEAPLKWQGLDVAYLVIDVLVVLGLLFLPRFGLAVFALAAMSQIILYTIFRSWILDVPAEFLPSPEQAAYLTQLVGFHVISLILAAGSLTVRGSWGSVLP